MNETKIVITFANGNTVSGTINEDVMISELQSYMEAIMVVGQLYLFKHDIKQTDNSV